MKKLRLDLNDLKIESFVTTPEMASTRGTVFGQDTVAYCGSGGVTCTCGMTEQCATDYSCNQTGCCPNDSNDGYESCGTTCMEPSCVEACPPSLHAPPWC